MMEIVNKSINDLKFAEYNPRQISKHDFESLKKAIEKFGLVQPIVINNDNTIIGGHMRVKAAKELGKTEMPCIVVSLDKAKEKLLNLALNRIQGEWDPEKLKKVIFDLDQAKIDLSFSGFTKQEIGTNLDLVCKVEEDDFDAEVEAGKITTPESKLGEVYQLGNHRLMCGDSTKQEEVEKLMNGQKADMIFTDPPYNVNYRSAAGLSYDSKKYGNNDNKIFNDDKNEKDFYQFLYDCFVNMYICSKDTASFYVWHADKTSRTFWNALEASDWHVSQRITWIKDMFVMAFGQDFHRMFEPCLHGWKKGKKYYFNKKINNISDCWNLKGRDIMEELDVWIEHRDNTNKYEHPTQKPIRLAELALKKSSKQGDIILDLFGGSGSTLIGCEQMNRICYSMELDPKYCDVIKNRYAKFVKK